MDMAFWSMRKEADWPSKQALKKWPGYTEVVFSAGSPKRVVGELSEGLAEQGYEVDAESFKLSKVGGWDDIVEVDARIHAVRNDYEVRPLLPVGGRLLAMALPVGIASGFLIPVGYLLDMELLTGLGMGLFIVALGLWWTTARRLGREIVVEVDGEARKAVRLQGGDEGVGSGEEEPFVSSDVKVRLAGHASDARVVERVKEDVKSVVSGIHLKPLLKRGGVTRILIQPAE